MHTLEEIYKIKDKAGCIRAIGASQLMKILASLIDIERDMRDKRDENLAEYSKSRHDKIITEIRIFIPALDEIGMFDDKSPFREKFIGYKNEYLIGESDFMGVHDLTI